MSFCRINIATGGVRHYGVDLCLGGFIPCRLARDYDSGRLRDSPLGRGWRHNQDHRLRIEKEKAVYTSPSDAEYAIALSGPPLPLPGEVKWQLVREGDAWLLSDPENNVLRFDSAGVDGRELRLKFRIDPRGNRIEYVYYRNGVLRSIRDTMGRILTFDMDSSGRITAAAVR